MTEGLSTNARRLLLVVAAQQGWTTWEALVSAMGGTRAPKTLGDDLRALVTGGSVQVQGTLDARGLEAELQAGLALLRQAQASGTTLTWKSAQTYRYALTPTGADMANLLAQRTR